MPCVVESGLEAREADSFEYRRAALDRLRDRGLLSEREHRRKLARARSRLAELERARLAAPGERQLQHLGRLGVGCLPGASLAAGLRVPRCVVTSRCSPALS